MSALVLVTYLLNAASPAAVASDDRVLVSVNGRPIRQADLQLEAILRLVPESELDQRREFLLDQLIDAELIAEFLSHQRIKPNAGKLEAQLEKAQAFIRRRGEEPDALFERIGLDNDRLRERLMLTILWQDYVARITSDKRIREYFAAHRRQFDGTQLRARQILLKTSAEDADARAEAHAKLAELREKVASQEISFETAAKEYSQAPSASQGGDVGFFEYRGTMPASFADAAFQLEIGEISPPVDSPFGVQLIQVTEERPGELSLEDVRPQLLEQISSELWAERVAEARKRAQIVRE